MRSPFFPAFSKDFLGLIFVSLALTRVSLPAVDSYVVSTLAGVPSGHDGHGIEVDFSAPQAVTADANGNIYIADTDHHTIRQVLPSGEVITRAGRADVSGSTDAVGEAARFSSPKGIAVGPTGILYVADSGNHTIRAIAVDGTVTTLAGAPGAYGAVDGTGLGARFHTPLGIALDLDGNIVVADQQNHVIRKVTPEGVVTKFAGQWENAGANDGLGVFARFAGPSAVTVDDQDNVFVSDTGNYTIRKITPAAQVSTWAGSAGQFGTTDGVGDTARFAGPHGITVDAAGNLYVCDMTASAIRKIAPDRMVTTLAGSAEIAGLVDGAGTHARFHSPRGVTKDADGNLVVADTSNDCLRRVTPGGIVTTLLGRQRDADGTGAAARFFWPLDVAVDSFGHVWVADWGTTAIREVTPTGNVSTFARIDLVHLPSNPSSVAVSATNELFASMRVVLTISPDGTYERLSPLVPELASSIAIDPNGDVIIASAEQHTIARFTRDGILTILAGSPNESGSVDAAGTAARFWGPNGVAVDHTGNIFVADSYNATIRKITPDGEVTTLAGSPQQVGEVDGVGPNARFRFPTDLAADANGNIFVTDAASFTVRRITPAGEVTTVAGAPGEEGYVNGNGADARFGRNGMGPQGIAVTSDGRIYVADSGNDAIRVITPVIGPDITGPTASTGSRGVEFVYTIETTGLPTSFDAHPLPPGLVIDTSSGIISGTPTSTGIFPLTISASDETGVRTAHITITIVPAISLGQPAASVATAGSSTSLRIDAGGGAVGYQWQKLLDGAWRDLPTATTATYGIPCAQFFHAGSYRVLVTENGATGTSPEMTLSIQAPLPNNARLLNLSTRAQALIGDNILIPGFVVAGNGMKKLLIRAVGPTLKSETYKIASALENPRMTLKRLDFSVQPPVYLDVDANDDWLDNDNAVDIAQAIEDLSAFPFEDDREAALLVDLAPGQYTVFADGVGGATGVAIVELYDADTGTPDARLANISNRGFVGTGEAVMIPGFVISSEGPKTLLVRVVGPTLAGAPYDVPGTLADPKLTIFSGPTPILENDNWGDNPDATYTAQIATELGAFAITENSKDAASVVTLPPGGYTVVGSAADGTSTGVVLVEVYVLD